METFFGSNLKFVRKRFMKLSGTEFHKLVTDCKTLNGAASVRYWEKGSGFPNKNVLCNILSIIKREVGISSDDMFFKDFLSESKKIDKDKIYLTAILKSEK